MTTSDRLAASGVAAFVTILALTGAPSAALAGTYWVSPTGQSAWTRCASQEPLGGAEACSIRTASVNAVAGDLVYIRGGTYSGDTFIAPANSGAPGRPIVFAAYNNESVVVNNQKVPNGNHEVSAWTSWNGARVGQSSERAWDGAYSTRFTSSAAGQGTRSAAFRLPREVAGLGYYYTFRVYSDRTSVNLQVRSVNGRSVPVNEDLALTPNQWNVFSGYISLSAADDFYVVFSSTKEAPSGTWYVDGSRLNPYRAGIYLNDRDHIVVRGIHFESVWRGLEIRNGADHNEISECSFTDMNVFSANIIWNGNGAGEPSIYNWIHDCEFHDSGSVRRTPQGGCEDSQTLLRIGNDTSNDASSFNLIERNVFYHGGHDLVIIATKFNTFRNNVLHNEGWIPNRTGACQDSDGDPTTFNNPAMFGNRGLLFETPGNNGGHNLVEGNRVGFAGTPPDDDGANGIENPSDSNIVRYNFLFKNGAAGYYFKAQPGISGVDVLPDDNVVYNNTIYANGGGVDISAGYGGGFHLACGSVYPRGNPVGNLIKNNIVFGNTVAVARRSCAGYTYVDNFEQDPWFVEPDLGDPFSRTLPDLSLRAGSPAIDAAAPLTTVSPNDSGAGTMVSVVDARFFQDGTWGPPGRVQPDSIAIGRTTNTAQVVSVDREANVIVLSAPIPRSAGDPVWLHRKSDGALVLSGSGPDFGASEYLGTRPPQAPVRLRVIR